MILELKDSHPHHMKLGQQHPEENVNIDRFVYSHPYYFLYHEDRVIGHLYSEYKNAFLVFDIINN